MLTALSPRGTFWTSQSRAWDNPGLPLAAQLAGRLVVARYMARTLRCSQSMYETIACPTWRTLAVPYHGNVDASVRRLACFAPSSSSVTCMRRDHNTVY
jgi:hypothetical protein